MSTRIKQLVFQPTAESGISSPSDEVSLAGTMSSKMSSKPKITFDNGHFGKMSQRFFQLSRQPEPEPEMLPLPCLKYATKTRTSSTSLTSDYDASNASATADSKYTSYENSIIRNNSCGSLDEISRGSPSDTPSRFRWQTSHPTKSSSYGKKSVAVAPAKSIALSVDKVDKVRDFSLPPSKRNSRHNSVSGIPMLDSSPSKRNLSRQPSIQILSEVNISHTNTPSASLRMSRDFKEISNMFGGRRSLSTSFSRSDSISSIMSDSSYTNEAHASRLLAATVSSTLLQRAKTIKPVDEDDIKQLDSKQTPRHKHYRRRSYTNTKNKMEIFNANDVCPTPSDDGNPSDAEPDVVAARSVKDSWESVSEQPNCELCGMIFKTIPLLQKHVNWSLLHANNLKKVEVGDAKVEVAVVQEEGVQYKLMYSGSKFYWRTKLMVEIDLYHHIEAGCIEVVAFNHNEHVEMKRQYINSTLLTELLKEEVAMSVEEIRKRTESQDRFAKVDTAPLFEQEWRRVLATTILSKLEVEAVEGVDELFFKLPSLPLAIYPSIPDKVISVQIPKRRISGSQTPLEAIDEGGAMGVGAMGGVGALCVLGALEGQGGQGSRTPVGTSSKVERSSSSKSTSRAGGFGAFKLEGQGSNKFESPSAKLNASSQLERNNSSKDGPVSSRVAGHGSPKAST